MERPPYRVDGVPDERPRYATDVLASGSDRPRRRWLPVVLVAVAVVVAGLWWADVDQRRREYAALAARFSAAQEDVTYAQRRVASVVEYASPHIATAPEDVRAGLRQLVQDAAATQVPPLREASDAMAAVTVWPWHGALVEARSACVAQLDAWTTYVEAVARDARTLGRPQPQLDQALTDAREALHAAQP